MEVTALPHTINELLEQFNAPSRLIKHLQIVHLVANDLLKALNEELPQLIIDTKLVLFGAATHDIGKALITEELYQKGKKHELVGRQLLIDSGYTERQARFAKTHGNWEVEGLELEDLLVSLSDKIWKGKRIETLEEKIALEVSTKLNMDYWKSYQSLDRIIEKIALGADKRINWQRS